MIDALRRILARGQTEGLFRGDIDPTELHMSISAPGIFNVANRAHLLDNLGRDMASPPPRTERRQQIVVVACGMSGLFDKINRSVHSATV